MSKYINIRKVLQANQLENPSWAFVLESSACLTLETLLESKESGILESSIVVPNPDVGVLNDIKNKYPRVNLFKSTSHDFLKNVQGNIVEMMCSNTSHNDDKIPKVPWNGKFDFCWLDYCGTINSRSGRRRKEDIGYLFSKNMLSSSCVLVITLSQRGSPLYYSNEVIDSIIAHVQVEAAKSGFGDLPCVGVAKYVIKAKMITILFSAATGQQNQVEVGATDDSLCHTDYKRLHIEEPNVYARESLQLFDSWILFDTCSWRSTKLFNAYVYISDKIVNLIEKCKVLSTQESNHLLVLDNKLLPVTSRIVTMKMNERFVAKNKVSIILSNFQVDKDVATFALSKVEKPSTWTTSICKYNWQHFMMNPQLHKIAHSSRVVWLGYDDVARSGHSLQHCSDWPDLNCIFSNRILDVDNVSILGMHIKHSKVGSEHWDHIFTDWIVDGVKTAGARYGVSLKCIYGCRYVSHSPHLCLIFSTTSDHDAVLGSRNNVNVEHLELECKQDQKDSRSAQLHHPLCGTYDPSSLCLPKNFQEFCKWDVDRAKYPCNVAIQKKTRCVLDNLLNTLQKNKDIDTVLLYEPGNFIIYPGLVQSVDDGHLAIKHICLCPGNDALYQRHIANLLCGHSHDSQVEASCQTAEILDNNEIFKTRPMVNAIYGSSC